MVTRIVWLIACQLLVLAADPHTQAVEEWRKKYEEGLQAPYTGWLSVAGLYWLKPGENAAGAAEGNDVPLPRGAGRVGAFLFDPKLGSWKRRSSSGGPISSCRATVPRIAQRVIAKYRPRRRKDWGRPRLTGMNCRF